VTGGFLRPLAQHHDEPDRSGAGRRLLHGLGPRLLARSRDAIAIDGKTVRRSHDRSNGRAALHLVSAFATNSHLVLGQEAVDAINKLRAAPQLADPPNLPIKPRRRPSKPPRPISLKLRRKMAS
jgi:hypothetical protein